MQIHTEEIIRRRGLERGGRAQKFVDSEVLRYCDPMVPKRTGALIQSGIHGTVKGSGIIRYDIKYARKNYYENGGHGAEGTANGGKRGRLWFRRMKAQHKAAIFEGLRRICGRSR
ncbi:MAG: capsid protein [Oscillospiraceae bacterium]|nr:capsid protein [Oscillospiraceae bacterium]